MQGVVGGGLAHHRLPHMDDFHGLVTEAVNPQHFQRFPVEQDLQHAHPLAGDLRPRQILEKRLAHFVGHAGLGELLFGAAHGADAGNGIDTGGHVGDLFHRAALDDALGAEPALVVGGTGQ